MQISIYGTGYVGLVTGACLAELGHHVLCFDIDANKIAHIKQGNIPIYEPGLPLLIEKNIQAKRLNFSLDAKEAVDFGLLQFIAVGTPSQSNGTANVEAVVAVAKTIASYMREYKLIINKSTVPVGMASKVKAVIAAHLPHPIEFAVASNPEFLKEGSAVKDFLEPDRIIIGTDTQKATKLLFELYQKFNDRILAMDITSAELTKYAANAMLATKISFINEIANIADQVGGDMAHICQGLSLDPRIGPHFINPGCGYGGSCFPKDVKALAQIAIENNIEPILLKAVDEVNQRQKQILFSKVSHYFNHDLTNKTFALWGLAFKPNTNDIREASSQTLIHNLLQHHAKINAYDPVAMQEMAKLYPEVNYCDDMYACLDTADALIICTEWKQFKDADIEKIASLLHSKVIFDGRNIFDLQQMQKLGFTYFGIGRSQTRK